MAWSWGYASGLPDAVLLCDPETLMQYTLDLDERVSRQVSDLRDNVCASNALADPETLIPALPLDEIFVWQRKDFEGAIGRIQRVTEYVATFRFVVMKHIANSDGRLYRQPCSAPEVRSALDRSRHGRSSR
jgi:hypothetical protein